MWRHGLSLVLLAAFIALLTRALQVLPLGIVFTGEAAGTTRPLLAAIVIAGFIGLKLT